MKIKMLPKLLFPSLAIFVSLILSIIIGVTQFKVIKELRTSVKRLDAENEVLKNKFLMLSSLDESNIKEQFAYAELAIPSEKNIPYVLQAFRDAVSKANFLVKTFQFSPGEVSSESIFEDKNKAVEKLPLTAELVGPSDELNGLVEALENTFPLFEVNNVSFLKESNSLNKARVELKLTTFYSPPLPKEEQKNVKLDQLVMTEEESALLENLATFSRPELKRRTGGGLERRTDNPFVF
jgi:hypothetical protein